MKKINYIFFLAIFSLSFFTNCGNDDSPNTEEPSATLEQEREASVAILTGGNNGVWRISGATLENISGTFNISNNFNVVDDEFIFSGTAQAGMLQWRQGNAINIEATSIEETLLDYYKSPENSTFSFIGNTNNELNSFDSTFKYIIVDSETINLTITYDKALRLILTLVRKQPSDYISAPSSGLNFTEVFNFESGGISGYAPGLIGSYSDNSFFLVTREDELTDPNGVRPERIIKYDNDTGTTLENIYFHDDIVSKQLHIINNELVAIGGQHINTYPFDFQAPAQTSTHGLELTRFGMAVQDDTAYILGGGFNGGPTNNPDADKIYGWNLNTQTLSTVATMPEHRFGARGAIVNDKLYVFGGMNEFFPIPPNPNNTIFIYDLVTGSVTSETLPLGIEQTFASQVQNLIYVAGHSRTVDSTGAIVGYEFSFGVYDTALNTYQNLTNSLPNPNGLFNIWGMCTYNGKMYVVYGESMLGGGPSTWSVMAANLN